MLRIFKDLLELYFVFALGGAFALAIGISAKDYSPFLLLYAVVNRHLGEKEKETFYTDFVLKNGGDTIYVHLLENDRNGKVMIY